MGVLSRPVVHSPALVLRNWSCGDTSCIASLLTRQEGFVKVLAKGVRKPGSRLRPLVEPGRLVEVEFGLDPNRELQFLRGGSVQLDPMAMDPTLEKSAFLLAALELVDRCRPAGPGQAQVDVQGLYEICGAYLRMLSSTSCQAPALLFFAFEWELLARHGMAPEIDSCISCGTLLADLGQSVLWFSPGEGGLVCDDCSRQGIAGKKALGSQALALLRGIAKNGLNQDLGQPLPRTMRREVGAALHQFLGYHLPGYRLPTALDLLRNRPAAAGETEE